MAMQIESLKEFIQTEISKINTNITDLKKYVGSGMTEIKQKIEGMESKIKLNSEDIERIKERIQINSETASTTTDDMMKQISRK